MPSTELKMGVHDVRLSIGLVPNPVAIVGLWSAAATALLIAAFDLTFGFTGANAPS